MSTALKERIAAATLSEVLPGSVQFVFAMGTLFTAAVVAIVIKFVLPTLVQLVVAGFIVTMACLVSNGLLHGRTSRRARRRIVTIVGIVAVIPLLGMVSTPPSGTGQRTPAVASSPPQPLQPLQIVPAVQNVFAGMLGEDTAYSMASRVVDDERCRWIRDEFVRLAPASFGNGPAMNAADALKRRAKSEGCLRLTREEMYPNASAVGPYIDRIRTDERCEWILGEFQRLAATHPGDGAAHLAITRGWEKAVQADCTTY